MVYIGRDIKEWDSGQFSANTVAAVWVRAKAIIHLFIICDTMFSFLLSGGILIKNHALSTFLTFLHLRFYLRFGYFFNYSHMHTHLCIDFIFYCHQCLYNFLISFSLYLKSR